MPEQNKLPYREPDIDEAALHADSSSEEKIITAFIAGDLSAFKYVYNKYRERIFSYCLYVTGNRAQADDAFQEVFIRVYQRREQLREAKALKNWLLLITRSVCLNLARESVFTPEFIYLDDELQGHSERRELSFEGIDQDLPEQLFQFAFNKIAPIYRVAFLLREIEGFSCEEVAEMTGASVSNVKVRILRAKKMLREILAPHFKSRLEKMDKDAPPDEKKEEIEVIRAEKLIEVFKVV